VHLTIDPDTHGGHRHYGVSAEDLQRLQLEPFFSPEDFPRQYPDVFIIDLLFLVGQHQEAMVDLIEFLLAQLNTQCFEPVIQCSPAASGGKDDR